MYIPGCSKSWVAGGSTEGRVGTDYMALTPQTAVQSSDLLDTNHLPTPAHWPLVVLTN